MAVVTTCDPEGLPKGLTATSVTPYSASPPSVHGWSAGAHGVPLLYFGRRFHSLQADVAPAPELSFDELLKLILLG